MSFKFKVNDNTTLDDARNFLDELRKANVKELYLNDIRKVLTFLGVTEIGLTGGSAIRFKHESLIGQKYHLDGIFIIHIIHKGGNQQIVTKNDFKNYMYDPLVLIIELLKNKK